MENPYLHSFLAALKGLQSHDGYYTARCPAHDDQHSSLSVTPTDDGKILVNCHCGCKAQDIVHAAGFAMTQMFPAKQAKKEKQKKITATYDYFDEAGVLVYQVCRMEWEEKGKTLKTFAQRRPDGKGGFTWKIKGLAKTLYRLPELLIAPKDKPVWIVEGEKQVDYLRSLGLIATCNTGGAGKWTKTYGKLLKDRDVIVVPDADLPNEKTGKITGALHALAVAESCFQYANTVHILQLPDCQAKWGLDDWLQKGGHTVQELAPLLEACPQYPEGDLITEVPVNQDDNIDGDPLKIYRDKLDKIGITYCAKTEDGRVEVFSTERRKFDFLPSRVTYADLISCVGLSAIRWVKENGEDSGDFTLSEIRNAIAAVSSATSAIDDKRGQGCWTVDEDRIAIVNEGEIGILNGRPKLNRTNNPMFDDKAYSIGQATKWVDFDVLEDDLAIDGLMYQKELDKLVEIIAQFNFGDEKFRRPELVAGLLLASFVQACWPLRPQVFLIGQSYSGKTTLMSALVQIVGKMGRKFSSPSAAALRAFIKTTSQIAMLDEIEKSKHRKEIFEMIRASARGDRIIRSSANQMLREFSVNNIFWAAAIEPGVVEEADKTRFIVIEMKKTAQIPTFPSVLDCERLGECLGRLMICRFRQALRLIGVLKQNVYSEKHGRLNECYAVPAAAYAAARGLDDSDAVLMFHDFMGAVELDEDITVDHAEVLAEIFDAEIRNNNGIIRVGQSIRDPAGFDLEALAHNGITKDFEYYYFNRNLLSRNILKGERWDGVRIDLLLMRFEGAERKKKKFGSSSRQAVVIPVSVVDAALNNEKNEIEDEDPFSRF